MTSHTYTGYASQSSHSTPGVPVTSHQPRRPSIPLKGAPARLDKVASRDDVWPPRRLSMIDSGCVTCVTSGPAHQHAAPGRGPAAGGPRGPAARRADIKLNYVSGAPRAIFPDGPTIFGYLSCSVPVQLTVLSAITVNLAFNVNGRAGAAALSGPLPCLSHGLRLTSSKQAVRCGFSCDGNFTCDSSV